ncbi:hypothetical protein HY570_00780 [Candidatus Micrarchaeota archaeon]|nr:hypothetical protein [Candidatus Micrarchaeota archaeon]
MSEPLQRTILRSSNGGPNQGQFPSPVSTPQRHLIDCKVTLFTRENAPRYKANADCVLTELDRNCKELSIIDCDHYHVTNTAFIPTTVQSARDSNIAIFTFYQYREELVEQLVDALRRENPELYIVFISYSKKEIPEGTADLVLTGTEIFPTNGSSGLRGSLSALLTETSIGERIRDFTYEGKSYYELSPAAQRAVRAEAVIEREVKGKTRRGYVHMNKGRPPYPGGFVELTATVGEDAIVSTSAAVIDNAKALGFSKILNTCILEGNTELNSAVRTTY